jgi:predicted transcriptional regulator
MTYRTGSIGEFMRWTKRVVTDPNAAANQPKRWFDSDATAAKVLGTATSAEAMVKLLSEENLVLLHLIAERRPASLRELASLANRKESNLSRTLKKLRSAGIVDFEEGPGRARVPRVTARRVTLELDLVGPDSSVPVERAAAD